MRQGVARGPLRTRLYRRIRQNEVAAPPNVISSHESKEPVDGSLITDLDSYFDLCAISI